MTVTQEFLVVPSNGRRLVYGVDSLPAGTIIGAEAERLRIEGPVWVKPPRVDLTSVQWESWMGQLRDAGFKVEVGPFWTTTPAGRFQPLSEVVDELLRTAR